MPLPYKMELYTIISHLLNFLAVSISVSVQFESHPKVEPGFQDTLPLTIKNYFFQTEMSKRPNIQKLSVVE